MTADTADIALPPVKTMNDIPGWFYWADRAMFRAILAAQGDTAPGHLVELGTYMGKSSVVVGEFQRPDERFVVVDLFEGVDVLGETAADRANLQESLKSYKSLTRQAFEHYYSAIRGDLPEVVAGMSSEIVDHLEPGTVRFMHIDASHLYEAVRVDVDSAYKLLRPGGVVVFDDIRSEHTPGVTAAAWEAVFRYGMIPVALTTQKLYAVFSEPDQARAAVRHLYESDDRIWHEVQDIAGHPVVRLGQSASSRRRDDEKKKARQEAERQAQEDALARAREEGAQEAERANALAVDTARKEAVEDYRRSESERRTATQQSAAQRRRTAEPRTLAGKAQRFVAREIAPPALTRWVLSKRR